MKKKRTRVFQNDLFSSRKCIHVKLRYGFLEDFKVVLMRRKLSMQELFDQFAEMIATEDKAALKIVDTIVYNKNKKKMDELLRADTKPTPVQETLMRKSTAELVPERAQELFYDLVEKNNPLNRKK